MDFITTLFESLQQIVASVGALLGSVFESVIGLIYNGEGLTVVGVLLLIGAAVGLFFFVFRWIRGAVRLRG